MISHSSSSKTLRSYFPLYERKEGIFSISTSSLLWAQFTVHDPCNISHSKPKFTENPNNQTFLLLQIAKSPCCDSCNTFPTYQSCQLRRFEWKFEHPRSWGNPHSAERKVVGYPVLFTFHAVGCCQMKLNRNGGKLRTYKKLAMNF